jgi:hypothetical protein
LTRALTLFNRLPTPIKQVAAQLLALKIILGGLGITALIAPLGRFASNMFLASRAAGKVAGPLAAAGGAATASTGKFGRLGTIVKTAGATLLGFARFAGPVALVLTTIGTAAFAGFIKQVRPAAQALLPTLVKTLRTFASGLLSAVSPARTLRGQVQDLIGRFAQFVRSAAPPLVAALKSINQWLARNQPLFRTIGRIVGTVLVGAFKFFSLQAKLGAAAVRFVVRAFEALKTATEGVITAIENVIEKIGDLIPKFKTSGKNAAIAFVEGFKSANIGTGVAGVLQNAYERFRKHQQESSPAKLWIPSGRNAALGYLQGFEEGMKGDRMKRALSSLQGTPGGAAAVRSARSANSPGGKHITAAEMRAIMKEAHSAQGKQIYAAAVAAGLDPRALRLLDQLMGGYIDFRNGAGVAPN